MKFPAPLAIALQTAFNRYIKLDPESATRLAPLLGKVVCVHIDGVNVEIWFLFHETRVEVVEEFGAPADVVIAGGPFSLLAQSAGKRSVFDGDVKITGDIETAQRFSRLLNEIDVDWEEHLSHLTGDALAHQIGRFSRGVRQWVTHRSDSVRSDTADYLRDETDNLPHDWELEEFVEQVDDLRDRVESLEARLADNNMIKS